MPGWRNWIDAPHLECGSRKGMEVRVLSWAPGRLAQTAEQPALNGKVVGAIPTLSTRAFSSIGRAPHLQ